MCNHESEGREKAIQLVFKACQRDLRRGLNVEPWPFSKRTGAELSHFKLSTGERSGWVHHGGMRRSEGGNQYTNTTPPGNPPSPTVIYTDPHLHDSRDPLTGRRTTPCHGRRQGQAQGATGHNQTYIGQDLHSECRTNFCLVYVTTLASSVVLYRSRGPGSWNRCQRCTVSLTC